MMLSRTHLRDAGPHNMMWAYFRHARPLLAVLSVPPYHAHSDQDGSAHSRLVAAIAAHQQRSQRHFICEHPVDPHTVYSPGQAPWRHLYTAPQVRRHIVDACMSHVSVPGASRKFMRSHIFTTRPNWSEPFLHVQCDECHRSSSLSQQAHSTPSRKPNERGGSLTSAMPDAADARRLNM